MFIEHLRAKDRPLRDLSRHPLGEQPQCMDQHPVGYFCTLLPDHEGQHEAGGITHIIAFWDDDRDTDE